MERYFIAALVYVGGVMVLCPKFEPDEAMAFCEKYQITIFGGVPTIYRLIFKTCDTSKYDLSSVKFGFTGGEPSSPELIHSIQQLFPSAVVIKSWGMSETAGYFTFTDPKSDIEFLAKSEGAPGEGLEMRILRKDRSWADVNEVGEMLVKGDTVMKSYMDKGDNQKAFHDGWLKTGDLGYLDENNNLF